MNAKANTLTIQRPPRRTCVSGGLRISAAVAVVCASLLTALASERAFTPYAAAKPILEAQHNPLPAELRNANDSRWLAWARRRDKAIRARLVQGDLDSMVNLLLYGTSFTGQPRIHMENLTEASKAGVLRGRVDDLVAGVRSPGDNERLQFLQHLLRNQGIDPDDSKASGVFVYKNLLRVLEERKSLAARAAEVNTLPPAGDAAALLNRESLFQDRGLSLDTSILPDFSIEQTLRDLKQHGVVGEGQVARVAVVGPGLDFIDKNEDSAYDYYPEQTLQPFALYDSILRLKLAKLGAVSLSVLDISPRVLDHLQRARKRARQDLGYVIQLPHDVARHWPPDLVRYWNSLGDQVGSSVSPLPLPRIFPGLQTRAISIRPEVVLGCQPADLDIVLERLDLAPAERFDLIVATNLFVYYNSFEQSLALENVAAMLKPGGLLLTNDRLPELPDASMRLAGITVIPFDNPGAPGRQAVGWYQKR